MDRDELWLNWDADFVNDRMETDEELESLLHESYVRAAEELHEAEVTAHEQWLNRRINRHRRRPMRQLHPCHRTAWQRSLRADRSYAISERQRLVGFDLDQDMREQLDDYAADQFTDVPSVGVTSYISYFARNVGEYPLNEYERGDFADDNEEDEAYEPAWRKYGFNSEAEYQDYLDECGSVYDDDMYEPSYAEARSELYADTSLDQLETA